jgi:hypothetical protein
MLDAAIWIVNFLLPTEGCCDGTMIPPDVETWIFGFPLHAEGCCDGVVIFFMAVLCPC